MKRHPALRELSSEHHRALVLATRAQRATPDEAANRALAAEAVRLFADELEPHFQQEESGLLVELEAAGCETAVRRTQVEHAELRQLASQLNDAPAALPRFGERLAAHIRYEERELFPLAEATLAPEALGRIGAPGH